MDPLLKLLQENARETHATLATMLGLTEAEVDARIRAYEEQGVIRGYRAVINEDRTEVDRVEAVIEVKLTPEREGGFDRLALRISRFPEVTAAFLMSGQADLMLFVQGATLREVASFVSEKLATIEGVRGTVTHFMLKTYKHHGVFMETPDAYERLKVTP